jgi:MFS family permease
VRAPFLLCLVIGLGGLFVGVTGPLLSAFVPPLVRSAVGEHRALIGTVMALDNGLLLLLVPWAGAASDRARARGRTRLPLVLGAYVTAAAGMALLPYAAALGLAGLLPAMLLLYSGINLPRSPYQALVADVVPSRYRSLATGSYTFQMCAGAIVFLMLGRALGMQGAFMIAAATVLVVTAAFALTVRETTAPTQPSAGPRHEPEPSAAALADAAMSAIRGTVPGLRAVFVASLLLQLTFQTFTTWYALHGTERFGVPPEDVTIGMIAWALGGVLGALPAGFIGVRLGRRNAMLAGFALMAVCLVGLHGIGRLTYATPLLALASAAWTLPTVNAYPLFVEPIPHQRRGVLSALFVLSQALGGLIGDPLNGFLFDLFGSYRSLFLLMVVYTMSAFVSILFVPRGAGEADTGPELAPPRREEMATVSPVKAMTWAAGTQAGTGASGAGAAGASAAREPLLDTSSRSTLTCAAPLTIMRLKDATSMGSNSVPLRSSR